MRDRSLLSFTLSWLGIWAFVFVVLVEQLKRVGFNYFDSFYVVSSMYFLASLGVLKLNFNLISDTKNFKRQIFQVAVLSFLITICLEFTNSYLPIDKTVRLKISEMGFFFPYWQWESSVSKIVDVFFQQIMIFLLLKKWQDSNITKPKVVLGFSLLFGCMHLPLLYLFPELFLTFTPLSFLGAGLFAYLMTSFTHGFTYSFALHMLFYVSIGYYFREYHFM